MRRRKRDYDVALSFAGEDRPHAEKLATILAKEKSRVFYDEFEKGELWGKDLYQHLQKIYEHRATYCVVFVSKHYLRKRWTKHELKHAQARAFADNRDYILPVRLDDAVLPGLSPTVGYLTWKSTGPLAVANLLLEKLGRKKLTDDDEDRASWNGERVKFRGETVASFWPKRLKGAQRKTHMLITAGFERIRYGGESRWHRQKSLDELCHDCAARPGEFHVPGCDMEECPLCRGQAISCDCDHEDKTPREFGKWLSRNDY